MDDTEDVKVLTNGGTVKNEKDGQRDNFENAVHYLGNGEPRRCALAIRANLENTPYGITSYTTSSGWVWAIYLKEKGRPKYRRDCLVVKGPFHTPAKTKKSIAWRKLAEIEKWLKKQKVLSASTEDPWLFPWMNA